MTLIITSTSYSLVPTDEKLFTVGAPSNGTDLATRMLICRTCKSYNHAVPKAGAPVRGTEACFREKYKKILV